ncbi:MAG: glycoside hydrolase [Steroidobacteraceae bacterium]
MNARALALGLLLLLPCTDATATQTPAVVVEQNEAMAALTGPWRFHVGDNPGWADPGRDDSDWELVDLAAPASATDGDVGLPHYAPGWAARGHSGYYGYAWYRLHLRVQTPPSERLALLGPWQVDSAYQVFANGRLLGGVGDFSGATPVAHGYHYPTFFVLPPPPAGSDTMVIAIRVWMGPWGRDDPRGGGIHIAPAIGARSAIAAQYHLQWLKIFAGYAVDAVPALLFFLAAAMVLCLQPFDRGGRAYPWLAAALTLSGIQRGNQPFFFWLQLETVRDFVIFIIALTGSLSLGAWMMAWRAWFKVTRPGWLPQATAALTLALAMAQLLAEPWMFNVESPRFADVSVHYLIMALRLAFLLVFVLIAYQGVRSGGRGGWYALPAVLAIGAVLFSAELAALHVPGIWFPFGVGLSLSECASMIFVLLLFAVLLRRLWSYSQRSALMADT